MRINQILFRNYRQLRSVDLTFPAHDNDLHIFVAENGSAKTNTLNGITWCLYNKEYHLSKESELFPLLNLNVIAESPLDSKHKVSVEIHVEIDKERVLIFRREQNFKIIHHNDVRSGKTQLTLYLNNLSNGETDIIDTDEIKTYLERTFPNRIRNFFFFDGERLDTYFKRATATNIKSAIKDISRINDLHSLYHRLKEIKDENTKHIGEFSPSIDRIRTELNENDQMLDKLTKSKDDCHNEIEEAKEVLKKIESELQGIPNIEKLEFRLEELSRDKRRKEKEKKDYNNALNNIVFDVKKKIPFWPIVKEVKNLIKDKRDEKKLPPPIDRDLLERFNRKNFCEIKNNVLPKSCKKNIEYLITQHEISHHTSTQLMLIEPNLNNFKERILNQYDRLQRINNSINNLNLDLDNIERDIKELKNTLRTHDNERIKDFQLQREKYEFAKDNNTRRLGSILKQIELAQESEKRLKKQFDSELHNKKIRNEIKKKELFLSKGLNVVETVIDNVTEEIKNRLENKTTQLFLELIWKKNTFKKIKIKEDFSLELLSVDDISCLGSTSAAERKLLALSFTLALHEVSGFDCPIIIDTPVSNVYGDNRRNIGTILSRICRNKQIVILFGPDEYTPNISNLIDKNSDNKNHLKLVNMEKEVEMEGFQLWQ